MINGKLFKVSFLKKNNTVITILPIDDYMNIINSECEKTIPHISNLKKITDDDIILPTINSYELVIGYNYSVSQLKSFAKKYKFLYRNEKLILYKLKLL